MGKLDYEQIMAIQENATRKLLNYIDDFFQKEKTIDSIEFYYPDFDERLSLIHISEPTRH